MSNAFVIHEHSDMGPAHLDVMLEHAGALTTWQCLDSLESIGSGGGITCVKIADHRLAYLTYEGPVSRGRGHVRAVDSGTYELLGQRDDLWQVRLSGRVLRGLFEFRRLAGDAASWTIRKLDDAAAGRGG